MGFATPARGGPPGPPGADGDDGAPGADGNDGADGTGYTLVATGTLTTTDGTPTAIVTISPPQNTVIQYWFIISGRDTTNQIGVAYIRAHGVERGTGAPVVIASASLLGGTVENAALTTATATISVSGNNILMSVTGVAGRTINWNCEAYSFAPV